MDSDADGPLIQGKEGIAQGSRFASINSRVGRLDSRLQASQMCDVGKSMSSNMGVSENRGHYYSTLNSRK